MTMVHPSGVGARFYGFPASQGAEFSSDMLHRFLLWRIWSPEPGKLLGFVMLNPSTADATNDDPTTTRNMARARRMGYAGIVQANLYSYRTPSPDKLKAQGYPGAPTGIDGGENMRSVGIMFAACQDVVLAWGAHARIYDAAAFVRIVRQAPKNSRLLHLGLLKNGMPRHPLMVSYSTPLQEWK